MKLQLYFIRFLYGLLTLFAIALVSLCIWGCSASKMEALKDARNAKKAAKFFDKGDQKSHATVADLCGQRFPPVASTKDEIIPGETITIHDTATRTIERKGDTVTITYHDTIKTKRTDTIRSTVVLVNNAALYAANDSNRVLRAANAKKDTDIALANQTAANWRKKALWAWGILAALLITVIVVTYLKMKGSFIKKVL